MIGLILSSSLLSLLILIALIYLLILIRPTKKAEVDPVLLCDYAHRGLHDKVTPENSLAAFSLACEEGLGMELDVQLSRDGEVMVFHDYTLKRMTGEEGKLCERTAEELSQLRLKDSDQTIPTFRQVLELVGGRTPLLVELKGGGSDVSLCPKVAELLSTYQGPYCIESFNPLLLGEIRKHLPDAYRGLLYTNLYRDKENRTLKNFLPLCMALNFHAKPNFIAYNKKDRDSLPVRLTTRLYKAPKFVWTVKTQEGVDLAHSLGEHPIFERRDKE